MTLGEALPLVFDEVSTEQSEGTFKSYKIHAKKALNYWGPDRELNAITRLDVQKWANLRRQECSAATVRHELAFLSRVFRTAMDRGAVIVPPTIRIRLPKINNKRERVLSIEEEQALSELLDAKKFSVIQFALQTGIRRLEQFKLRPQDVKLWSDGGVLKGMAHIKTSKTGLGRKTPLNPVAAEIAKSWLKLSQPYLFGPCRPDRYDVGQRYSLMLRTACEKLGIQDFRWHDLRHTCASRALQNGARMEQVQALLGHANITQTQRYCHWDEDHVWPAAMAVCAAHNRTQAPE